MKENFLKHFFIIGSGTVISMLLSLFTTPIITRIVSPETFGQLSIFLVYSQVAILFLLLGLDQSLVRFYYDYQDIEYKSRLLYTCVKWPVFIAFIVSVLVLTIATLDLVDFIFDLELLTILCLYVLLLIVYRFAQLIIRLEYNSKEFSCLNILQKAIYVVSAIPLLFIFNDNDLEILVCSTVFSLICCLVFALYRHNNIWNIKRYLFSNAYINEKAILKYASPYIISFSVMAVFNSSDRVILTEYCSFTEIGVYASAVSLVSILNLIQSTFNTIWAPMMVKHFKDFPKDKRYFTNANHGVTVIMLMLGVLLILCKDIMVLLLGEKYREASYLLPCLIFHPIMYTISETTVVGLVLMKKSFEHIYISLGAAITNIILCFSLIPVIGVKGAAISNAISFVVFWALRTYFSNKYFKVDYDIKRFMLCLMLCLSISVYCTFNSIDLIAVGMGMICLTVIMFLYRHVVIYGFNYLCNILAK